MQVLFFRGKSLISRAIKTFTWGEYSHVGLLTENGTLIEAWHKGGVIENPLHLVPHTPGTEIDAFHILGDFDPETLLAEMRSEVGKGYDFTGIFGFISRRRSEKPDRWFCSELIFAKLARAGCLALNAPAHKVDPTLLSYSPCLKYLHTFQLGVDQSPPA